MCFIICIRVIMATYVVVLLQLRQRLLPAPADPPTRGAYQFWGASIFGEAATTVGAFGFYSKAVITLYECLGLL